MVWIKIFSKLKIDKLYTIYIFWFINNHSFIQINFTCVLGLIKDEEKNNSNIFWYKWNTNRSVTISDH
jgi:hypothetical protein